jgi:uncharacterized protein (DUF1778 family)
MRMLIPSTLLVVLINPSASAQVTPLDMIPGSAAVVIRLQAPQNTTEDLAAFVNKVQPGFGDLAKAQWPSLLGRTVSNPTLAGVDQSRDWYAALFTDGNGPMKGVLLLPTTGIADVKQAMGPSFDFVEKDGWLACSKDDQYHDEFERCLSGDVESLAKTIDDRTKATLMSGHLGVVVNAPVLRDAFAEELGSAEDRLEDLIQIMGEQIKRGNSELDVNYIFDVYRDFGKAVLQGVRDTDSAVISVNVTDNAVQIDHLLTVAADSQTNAFFLTQPVSDMARLTSVPEGLAGYVAIHANPHVMFDWSERMMSKMVRFETAGSPCPPAREGQSADPCRCSQYRSEVRQTDPWNWCHPGSRAARATGWTGDRSELCWFLNGHGETATHCPHQHSGGNISGLRADQHVCSAAEGSGAVGQWAVEKLILTARIMGIDTGLLGQRSVARGLETVFVPSKRCLTLPTMRNNCPEEQGSGAALDLYGVLPYKVGLKYPWELTMPASHVTLKTARIETRVSADQKELIERAAAYLGRTVSDFVIAHAELAAKKVVEDYERLHLDREQSRVLVEALLSQSSPNKLLQKAVDGHRKRVTSR